MDMHNIRRIVLCYPYYILIATKCSINKQASQCLEQKFNIGVARD